MSSIFNLSSILNNLSSTDITQKVKGLFSKKLLLIMVIVVIFLGVAFYVYNTYVAPRINPDFVTNREFDDGDDVKIATLYFFSVDWCPFSKKAKPVWEKLKKKFNNKKINNVTLRMKEIDGEKNETELDDFENTYLAPTNKKIDGYPSIWMVKGTDVTEFDQKPNFDQLSEMIHAIM
jgi:thiol-disulfide isomerase/thioredoxin